MIGHPRLPGMQTFTEIRDVRELHRYIRTYVAEMLTGFADRQRIRAEARKQKRTPKAPRIEPEQKGLFDGQ